MSSINETAQQFIALCLRENIDQMADDAANDTVDKLLEHRYPQEQPADACQQLIINSVAAGIEKAINSKTAETDRWIRVGQMDLFDTAEFFIPQSFLGKSVSETCAYLKDRLDSEEERRETFEKALREQERITEKVRKSTAELARLEQGVIASGQDPHEVLIEQAIQQARQVQPWDQAETLPTAKRTMRMVRAAAQGADPDRSSDPAFEGGDEPPR